MYAVSTEFLEAIRASHTMTVKATAYRGTAIVPGAQDLQVLDGSVRVDGNSNVRRTVDGLRIASPDGTTETLRALLDERSTELQISRGVVYTTGRIELAPVARVRVRDIEDDLYEPGVVSLSGDDRAARVIDDKLLTPRSASTGTLVTAQITTLIQESISGVAVFNDSGTTATVPAGIVFERERWDEINKLAAAISCAVYADPKGSFRITPIPTFDAPAVWTISSGRKAVLLGGQRKHTRDNVYNCVVATSSPTDGAAPVVGIAQDTDPNSPTRVSGPYGRVPRFYSSPLLGSQTQAVAAAQALLEQSLGRNGTITLNIMVNPALEVGDRVNMVLPDGITVPHIVDGFDLPLSPGGSMTIETRATRPTVSEE